MRLSPTPRVFMTVPENPPIVVADLHSLGKENWVRLPGGPHFRVRTVEVKLGKSIASTVILMQNPETVIKSDEDLLSVQFDIINFPNLYHSLSLTSTPWQIEIRPKQQIHEIVKILNSDSGYGITHEGTVTRLDGRPFTSYEAEQVLLLLWWFLSFARGRSCGVALGSGTDQEGTQAWKQWGGRRAQRWSGLTTWLPRVNVHLSLPEAFSGFTRTLKLEGPFKDDPLRPALQWYLSANESNYPPTSIVLAQAALERLAYVSLSRETWNKFKCKKGATGRRICAALRNANVSPTIPKECLDLAEAVPGSHQQGPRAVVDLRNSLVHPQSERTISDGAYQKAAQLALWYTELLLLNSIGYNGDYVDRIACNYGGDWQTKPVPWLP